MVCWGVVPAAVAASGKRGTTIVVSYYNRERLSSSSYSKAKGTMSMRRVLNKRRKLYIDVWINHRYLDEAALDVGGSVMYILFLTTMTMAVEVVSLFFIGAAIISFYLLQLQVQPTT